MLLAQVRPQLKNKKLLKPEKTCTHQVSVSWNEFCVWNLCLLSQCWSWFVWAARESARVNPKFTNLWSGKNERLQVGNLEVFSGDFQESVCATDFGFLYLFVEIFISQEGMSYADSCCKQNCLLVATTSCQQSYKTVRLGMKTNLVWENMFNSKQMKMNSWFIAQEPVFFNFISCLFWKCYLLENLKSSVQLWHSCKSCNVNSKIVRQGCTALRLNYQLRQHIAGGAVGFVATQTVSIFTKSVGEKNILVFRGIYGVNELRWVTETYKRILLQISNVHCTTGFDTQVLYLHCRACFVTWSLFFCCFIKWYDHFSFAIFQGKK